MATLGALCREYQAIPAAACEGAIRHQTTRELLASWPQRALKVIISGLRTPPGPAGPSCPKVGTIDARAPALQTCLGACMGLSRPPRDLIGIAVFKVGLWLQSVQISRAWHTRSKHVCCSEPTGGCLGLHGTYCMQCAQTWSMRAAGR